MSKTNNLPTIEGYTWRGIKSIDGPSLKRFEQICARIDGATNLETPEEWIMLANEQDINRRSVLAINDKNEIAIAGWYKIDERVESVLAFLEGRVHPDLRGKKYGSTLLDWLEKNAGIAMKAVAGKRDCTYRIMFYDRALDASILFEEKGYTLQYIEQEMERNLKKPLSIAKDQDLLFESWTEENKSDFYAVYRTAFQTRTDNLMKAETWHHHFANPEDSDYQSTLSLLARQENTPVAYAVVHLEDKITKPAWITQTGVHADYRRQGIGAATLNKTMKGLRTAGYEKVKLSVNVNNLSAINLYEYLGFSLVNSFTMYYRDVDL